MHGRWFDERQLEAHIADGTEKFKKTNEKKADVAHEDDGEDGTGEEDRLDKFGEWLEEEQKGDTANGKSKGEKSAT
jgi:HIV Tat-specific factor 1